MALKYIVFFQTCYLLIKNLFCDYLVPTEAYSGQTYHISNDTLMTWHEASDYCSTLSPGAKLAVIDNEQENLRLTR